MARSSLKKSRSRVTLAYSLGGIPSDHDAHREAPLMPMSVSISVANPHVSAKSFDLSGLIDLRPSARMCSRIRAVSV